MGFDNTLRNGIGHTYNRYEIMSRVLSTINLVLSEIILVTDRIDLYITNKLIHKPRISF